MGRGIWGSPGARFEERAEAQLARADGFRKQAEEALAAGEDASRYEKLVENMTVAAERSEGGG